MLSPNKKVILASGSPRRKQLLEDLGFEFTVETRPGGEDYPSHLKGAEIAEYLAKLKSSRFNELDNDTILISADTVVWIDNQELSKPTDAQEAKHMLQLLSGKSHDVITGVCVRSSEKEKCFSVTTKVHFKHLAESEIDYYIANYQPFDKAGAYGIQEWIGQIGIEKIEGSYFNVVGLPVKEVYEALKEF